MHGLRAAGEVEMKTQIKIIALVFLCIGMFLRWRTRYYSGFDVDESCIISILSGSWGDLLRTLPRTEAGTYLSGDFYLLFPFLKLFGPNKWAFAFPHAVITVIGFYFLLRLCRLYFHTLAGYIVALGFWAFNGSLVRYALMARVYAVLPTLALGTLYYMHCLTDHYETMSARRKTGIALFLLLTAWYHTYGMFIIFVCTLFFALAKARDKAFIERLPGLLKFLGVVAAVALPVWFYCFMLGYKNDFTSGAMVQNTRTFTLFSNPLVDPARFMKNIIGNLVGAPLLYPLLLGFPLAMMFKQPQRRDQMLFFLVMIVLAVEIVFVPSVRSGYWFVQRHFIWAIAFFAFWMGWCWDAALSRCLGGGGGCFEDRGRPVKPFDRKA